MTAGMSGTVRTEPDRQDARRGPEASASLAGARPVSRRGALAFLAAGAALSHRPAHAAMPARVVTLDYGLAQTLIAMGRPPIALAAANLWDRWVVEPPLPEDIVNLGTSQEANLEILQQLKPDLIVSTPFLERLRPTLEAIAPVASYPTHATGSPPWPHVVTATRALGARLDAAQAAEDLIDRTESVLRDAEADVSRFRDRPILLIAFQDARNLWVFGANSLYDDALRRLRLRNGWTWPTNAWGFASVGVEALAAIPDARLVCLDPVPADAVELLRDSPIWRAVGFSGEGRMLRLPPVLAFGALPSVTRFVRLLVEAARHG